MTPPTILIVPGLRDHTEQHWQTLLEKELPRVRAVPPMGRDDLDCAKRVAAIEQVAAAIEGPIVIVAHSGGVVMVAHWALQTRVRVQGALLAAPPDFESPMPQGYPTLDQLRAGGWLPVPRKRLPFRSTVAASRNDPLARYARATELAEDWGSALVDLGEVGHLNPASGFGPWPGAHDLIKTLSSPA
ncbi:alpha/beta fold hydrolase [Hydrogenophaga sp. 2FB]|uniref:RBBP9/YdeN family alpha/beta hydrolase n=1 Tax=Hydrogenophaga sp. 2FB TaxID=2502187 RepID=UPI001BB21496|nr:alpha/beta fold hydrolase [Hydrogenophaga sp. 2FB]